MPGQTRPGCEQVSAALTDRNRKGPDRARGVPSFDARRDLPQGRIARLVVPPELVARVCNALLPALLGELRHRFGGPAETVRAFDPFWMAQIGWLAVQPGLKPGPTVAEHLRRTARLAGLPAVADDALLARWGLTPLRDRPVQYLSHTVQTAMDRHRLRGATCR